MIDLQKAEIEFSDHYIFWKTIRFELDDEIENDQIKSIDKLQFNRKQYLADFNEFYQ